MKKSAEHAAGLVHPPIVFQRKTSEGPPPIWADGVTDLYPSQFLFIGFVGLTTDEARSTAKSNALIVGGFLLINGYRSMFVDC